MCTAIKEIYSGEQNEMEQLKKFGKPLKYPTYLSFPQFQIFSVRTKWNGTIKKHLNLIFKQIGLILMELNALKLQK